MDAKPRKLNNQKIPGTYEYIKRKALRNEYSRDTNVWGKRTHINKYQAHEFMLGRMPGIYQYTIPREVGERVDLTPTAKLIYGFLMSFKKPTLRLFYREIAGMCGLEISAVQTAVYDLVERGLIKKWNTKVTPTLHGPTLYKIMPLPTRNRVQPIPSIMKTNITNIEEKIRERFYDA